jgi:hypothetical protein
MSAREEQARKARLAQVRANDSAHEEMMQAAARKAGVRLSVIRGMKMSDMDIRIPALFRKSGEVE